MRGKRNNRFTEILAIGMIGEGIIGGDTPQTLHALMVVRAESLSRFH
jgi:hypothetical protein